MNKKKQTIEGGWKDVASLEGTPLKTDFSMSELYYFCTPTTGRIQGWFTLLLDLDFNDLLIFVSFYIVISPREVVLKFNQKLNKKWKKTCEILKRT